MPEPREKPAPQSAAPPAPTPPSARPMKRPADANEDFRYIVRFANTDLDGARSVVYALQQVKGVGRRVAEIVADLAQVPRGERIGNLAEARTEEMEKVLASLPERVPPWILNRQNDVDTGDDYHVFGTEVDLRRRDDVNRMKMIRSYKGVRHEQGQKVRGQRTRSNGRTGLTVGVQKKAAIQAAQAAKKEEAGGGREKEKAPEKEKKE